MTVQRLFTSRRFQRLGKHLLLVFTLSVCSAISYSLYTFSETPNEGTVGDGARAINSGTKYLTTHELNVHIWRSLCGSEVTSMKKSLFFPKYPDEQKIISDFQAEDNSLDYGQKIFGFIHPRRSGLFRFAIASDDTSELWLSTNEDPDKKQLIARVFIEDSIAWTHKNELNKYPDQISKQPVILEAGRKYYVEVLHKQGIGNGFVRVFWTSSDNDKDFKLITSENLSSYLDDTSFTEEKVALHNALSGRYRQVLQSKSDQTSSEFLKFYSLPLISKASFLPSCDYKSSFVSSDKIYRYEGLKMVFESNVFPADDTLMSADKGMVWSRANRLADREIIQSVVDKIIASLRRKTSEEYVLKRIHKIIHKSDPVYGDRYSVDLELGLPYTDESYRFSEHVYQKKGSGSLCLPEGVKWNSKATVYIILPIKDQGRWVYHFINELTVASLLTGEKNFHVIVVDFESQDIDLTKAFNTPLLRSRHTLVNLTGKFYKTLALNTAVERVPSGHDLLFLFDLHIDVPIDILDSVRKNTIEGKIVYFPAVGRLICESTHVDHRGFWQMNGYGLLAVYKSDWIRFGGMNIQDFKYNWGGEDWDLLDRVVNAQLEVERIKYPGLYHHYHTKQKTWS